MSSSSGYRPLLADTRFEAFLWAQFLGAFNDNVYKMIVSIVAVRLASDSDVGSRYLALSGAVFVLPFLLFAGYAGQIADRFSKTRVLQVTKSTEILIMAVGLGALLSHRIEPLLLVLFLLATHSNFFSPAKYGILPELMTEAQLSRANGLIELSTFIAIVVGTSFGTFLFAHWKDEPVKMGGTLLGLAVLGTVLSWHIRKVPAAGSTEPFHLNPFHEVIVGTRELLARKPLALAVLGISWFWFVGALFQLTLILAGKEVLHVPETDAGYLVTALAVGIGIGSVVAGTISGAYIELGLVPAGSALLGMFAMILGRTHSFAWAIVWLVGVGFAGGLFAVPLNAFLQAEAGPSEKGRLLTTNNFINMVGVILASGVLWLLHDLAHWDTGKIMFALGVVTLLATAALTWFRPELALRFAIRCVITALFRIRVEGGERVPRRGGALLVSNHVSYADSALVGYATPRMVRFLMWQPIYDSARPIFRALHAIPIGADSPKQTIRALRAARAELEHGELVGIFPEGSITKGGELQPFERGVERVIEGLHVPILPVYLDGLFGHPLSYKNGGLFQSWERLWRPRITVRIGQPVFGPISAPELREHVDALAVESERVTVGL